jgi:hypothetical protein
MDPVPKVSREQFVAHMRQQVEEVLGQVADAINDAGPGQVVNGSEEKVRDLFADLRRQAYEAGVQLRMDAAEAAFSPSARPADRQEETQ